jgi:hypothetical protein
MLVASYSRASEKLREAGYRHYEVGGREGGREGGRSMEHKSSASLYI